jgi:hypothetical protein
VYERLPNQRRSTFGSNTSRHNVIQLYHILDETQQNRPVQTVVAKWCVLRKVRAAVGVHLLDGHLHLLVSVGMVINTVIVIIRAIQIDTDRNVTYQVG